MNNNYNNLYGDYIGATGIYSISDYIDITSNTLAINSSNFTLGTSNILNDKIFITSNTLNNKIDTTYNFILNRYDKLIKEETENNFINTYITNSNLGGEILFYNKTINLFGRPDYCVKINNLGFLELYYSYNSALNVLEQTGFKNILHEVVETKANVNLQGAFIGTLQLETAGIISYLVKNRPQNEVGELLERPAFDRISTYSALTTGLNYISVRLQNALFNNRYTLFLGTPIAGIIFHYIQEKASNDASDILANAIIKQYDSNITMTPQEKQDLLVYGSNLYINKVYDSLSNTCNINVFLGFINSNIQTQQTIPNLYASNISSSNISSFNLYTSNLYVNSGNINGIDINNLKTSGDIIESGTSLSSKYLTSNHLYNLSYNYTVERQYPSKLYTTSTPETTTTLLNKLVYNQTLFLDNQAIAYGSGFYEVYSSSTFDTPTTKDRLFNFNTSETTTSPRWAISLYNSGTGNYQGDNSIDGVYFGDWVIIKMPKEILLTRYRIYQRSDFLTKAPAEWKFYGSKDGINFIEITEATQATRLTSYSGGYFEKSLNQTFNIMYQYFGVVFNKILSTSGQSDLSFSELQLFGKEILNNSITSSIYATSNAVKNIIIYDTPVVCKHFAFYITITTPIVINSKNYYKYDIDLRQYTKLGYIDIGSQSGDSYRIFKLRACYGSMYFSTLVNGLPNVVYSDIFMSMKANPTANLGIAGLNICSIGNINNPRLDIVPSNNLFFMRNGANSIDYITVVSTNIADVRCFIEDMIS
jgi:hypothetical protein